MAGGEQWLLVRASGTRFALPAGRVRGLAPRRGKETAASEAGAAPVLCLGRALGLAGDGSEGIALRVEGAEGSTFLVVDTVEEVMEGIPAIALPALLRHALGKASPVVGALVWQGQTVLVVDPARLAAAGRCGSGEQIP